MKLGITVAAVPLVLLIHLMCASAGNGEVPKSPRVPHVKTVKTKSVSNVGEDVCAQVCSWWGSCTTYYCPGDCICCTPGSPESLCCPADHPVCLDKGCCETGYSRICGDKCCTSDSACCKDVDNCCKTAEACCNSNECCTEESPCCRNEGEKLGQCCDQEENVCCGDGYGCAAPCPSQFDAIPCNEDTITKLSTIESVNIVCPEVAETHKLYRVTDPDQNCRSGLRAKDPNARKTVSSHVGCGSMNNYKSQYISFSTSYDRVFRKYWPLKPPQARLVVVDVEKQLPADCKTYDLTLPANREHWLGHNPWAKNYAASDCEVLLWCDSPIRCTTKLGPKSDDEEEVENDGLFTKDKQEL